MIKKIIILLISVLVICSLCACESIIINDNESFSVDELKHCEDKTKQICMKYNYNYELTKSGNSVIVYDIQSTQNSCIEVAYLKWSEDDTNLHISIINDNILQKECMHDSEQSYNFVVDFFNLFSKNSITKEQILDFMADDSYEQNINEMDEVLYSKQFNNNDISITYQLICKNGLPSKQYKPNDLIKEVTVFTLQIGM